MTRHVVSDLIFDEHNEREMARHGVVRRGEPGSVLLVGETDGARLLTVPLAPTDDPTIWRPATAFDAGRHHRTLFDRRRR